MRKFYVLAVALALVIVGCHPKEETVLVGPNGEKMTTSHDGKQVSIHDDKGNNLTMGSDITEADLGLPFYPGSVPKDTGGMKFESNGQKSVMSSRTSKDAPDKILGFYKSKMSGTPTTTSAGIVATLKGKLANGMDVSVEIQGNPGGDSTIMVAVESGRK